MCQKTTSGENPAENFFVFLREALLLKMRTRWAFALEKLILIYLKSLMSDFDE